LPIYTQTYRTYEGQARRRFRWWVMVQYELRILLRTRTFVALVILGYLHACLRVLQVVTYDTLGSGPPTPLSEAMRHLAMMKVDETMFFDFIRLQGPLVFLATILAGAGMICDDYRNNLMEIFFSKPLTWIDYAMGKIMALMIIGLGFTAVPGILLVIVHNMASPSLATLRDTSGWPISIVLFSLTMVTPCALGVLASSAMSRSERYASIAIFMVLFANLTIGQLLPELLHNRDYAVVAFPLAVNRIGEILFHEKHPVFELPWGWSVLFVVLVCTACLGIIGRMVKRAEMAA
jgi:ABC-type transport system involved in multi-copper enzyme maturation permease subunit